MRSFLERFRRRGPRPRLRVRPSVTSLHSLAKDAPALIVSNIGNLPAHHVVVSIRVRHTAFQFDEIETLEPETEAPLLHQSSVGRFKLEQMTVSTHWFRIALRSVVKDIGTDLRIPMTVEYSDPNGVQHTSFATMHCDEHLHVKVTNT